MNAYEKAVIEATRKFLATLSDIDAEGIISPRRLSFVALAASELLKSDNEFHITEYFRHALIEELNK